MTVHRGPADDNDPAWWEAWRLAGIKGFREERDALVTDIRAEIERGKLPPTGCTGFPHECGDDTCTLPGDFQHLSAMLCPVHDLVPVDETWAKRLGFVKFLRQRLITTQVIAQHWDEYAESLHMMGGEA